MAQTTICNLNCFNWQGVCKHELAIVRHFMIAAASGGSLLSFMIKVIACL